MQLRDVNALEDTEQHIRNLMARRFDRFKTDHRKKNGSLSDMEVSTTYLPDIGQTIFFYKQAEKSPHESKEHFRQIVENRTDAAYSRNLKTRASEEEHKHSRPDRPKPTPHVQGW